MQVDQDQNPPAEESTSLPPVQLTPLVDDDESILVEGVFTPPAAEGESENQTFFTRDDMSKVLGDMNGTPVVDEHTGSVIGTIENATLDPQNRIAGSVKINRTFDGQAALSKLRSGHFKGFSIGTTQLFEKDAEGISRIRNKDIVHLALTNNPEFGDHTVVTRVQDDSARMQVAKLNMRLKIKALQRRQEQEQRRPASSEKQTRQSTAQIAVDNSLKGPLSMSQQQLSSVDPADNMQLDLDAQLAEAERKHQELLARKRAREEAAAKAAAAQPPTPAAAAQPPQPMPQMPPINVNINGAPQNGWGAPPMMYPPRQNERKNKRSAEHISEPADTRFTNASVPNKSSAVGSEQPAAQKNSTVRRMLSSIREKLDEVSNVDDDQTNGKSFAESIEFRAEEDRHKMRTLYTKIAKLKATETELMKIKEEAHTNGNVGDMQADIEQAEKKLKEERSALVNAMSDFAVRMAGKNRYEIPEEDQAALATLADQINITDKDLDRAATRMRIVTVSAFGTQNSMRIVNERFKARQEAERKRAADQKKTAERYKQMWKQEAERADVATDYAKSVATVAQPGYSAPPEKRQQQMQRAPAQQKQLSLAEQHFARTGTYRNVVDRSQIPAGSKIINLGSAPRDLMIGGVRVGIKPPRAKSSTGLGFQFMRELTSMCREGAEKFITNSVPTTGAPLPITGMPDPQDKRFVELEIENNGYY